MLSFNTELSPFQPNWPNYYWPSIINPMAEIVFASYKKIPNPRTCVPLHPSPQPPPVAPTRPLPLPPQICRTWRRAGRAPAFRSAAPLGLLLKLSPPTTPPSPLSFPLATPISPTPTPNPDSDPSRASRLGF
jgi:hypothetical protein